MTSTLTPSDLDLLSILIGRRKAARLLQITGGSLHRALNEHVAVYEIGEAARAKVQAARELVRRSLEEQLQESDTLSSSQIVREYLRTTLAGLEHESFWILFLDSQNRLLGAEEIARGTLTQTSVYPREVVKRALYRNAGALLIAHNHPSGVAEPSRADEVLTRALKEALALVDVKLLDHFVIASDRISSFAERGLL